VNLRKMSGQRGGGACPPTSVGGPESCYWRMHAKVASTSGMKMWCIRTVGTLAIVRPFAPRRAGRARRLDPRSAIALSVARVSLP